MIHRSFTEKYQISIALELINSFDCPKKSKINLKFMKKYQMSILR